MTESDYARTLDELERLLNDPDVPLRPGLIWRLLDKVSQQDLPGGTIVSRIMDSGDRGIRQDRSQQENHLPASEGTEGDCVA